MQYLRAFLCLLAVIAYVLHVRASDQSLLLPQCRIACSELAHRLGPRLHFPENDNFIVWDAKQQEVESACRVEPSSSEDVVSIMDIVVSNLCRFAVKSGGHARNPDDSVSVGGVTIDLVRMKSVEVSSDRTTARLGAGHILYTLYRGLEAFNLSTTGGRVADVGLSGFALGGGISNWSPQYGMAVDNVLEYEVVLANASLLRVNEYSHPDLYFALRGGMNNFGIVTHFTMRVFPSGQIYSGSRSFSISQRDKIVEEAHRLTTEWKNDTNMAFSYGFAYQQSSDIFTLSMTEAYTIPITHPAPFEAVNRLPFESSTLRLDWMSNFSAEGAAARPPGGRNLYATISYYPSPLLDKKIQDIMAEEIEPLKAASGFSPNVIFQPLYEKAIQAGRERGGNALGIRADGPLTMCLLTTQWSDAQTDDEAYAFAGRFITRATAAAKDVGRYHPWMYINYANQQQDPFSGYGAENLQRLRDIQKRVDPTGVFTANGLCRGYFKLL